MNKIWLVLLVLFASGGPTYNAYSQNFPMRHFLKEDGIPSNTIYFVYRDSKGYLWLASDKGVARYNGIKFDLFTTLDGLADNEVYFLKEDYYGRLWLASNNGELCYYQNGFFHNAGNTPFLKLGFKSPHIGSIILNKDSSISVNYEDAAIVLTVFRNTKSVHYLKKITDSTIIIPVVNREISENLFELICAGKDVLVDSQSNVKSIRRRAYQIHSYKFMQDQQYFFNEEHIYDETGRFVKKFPKGFSRKNAIYAICKYKTNFFIGTDNGLYIDDTINILKGKRVSSVTKDNTGNYWVSTLDNGIYSLDKNFSATSLTENCYTQKVKYCYQDASHLFFVTTDNNLYGYVENGGVNSLFEYGKTRSRNYANDHNAVHLVEKKQGRYYYYAIYGDDQILITNVLGKRPETRIGATLFRDIGVKSMLAADNKVYVHARRSVVSVADSTGFFDSNSMHEYSVNTSTNNYRVFGIAKAPDNKVYYSTVDGLSKIEGGVQVYLPQFNKLSFSKFEFLGKYLLGVTLNSRFVICNILGDSIIVDTIANQNCIWQKLLPLDSNRVIVSTNNLYRIITLYPSDSAPSYQVLAIENPFIPADAEAVCSDGKNCNFFKNGSITSIAIADLLIKPLPPSIFFTALKTRKKIYAIKEAMEIPFSEAKNISVSFSTLSFNGKDVSCEYSISNTEDEEEWIPINGDEINLNNLKYGDHFIKVRAATISSEPSAPILFRIKVSQPFWTTAWFIGLCVCTTLLGLGLATRHRVRSVLNKKEKEHDNQVKYLRAEYTAMNALMNPHFIFNTLNNVQSLFHENDLVGANEYLKVFAELIRQNMQNISKELIPLQMEIDLVLKYLYLEKMRFEDKLNFSINISKGIDTTDIKVPPLLIQPLVENSIKHGILPLDSKDGFIAINIYEQGDVLFIEVKDNGQGLKHPANQDNSHESFGLGNIKKRIHHLGIIQDKDISFDIRESQTSNGAHEFTIVTIGFPV